MRKILLLLFCLSFNLYAQDKLYQAIAYQQAELKLIDPEGDLHLLTIKSEKSFKNIFRMIFGMEKVLAEVKDNNLKAKQLYPEMFEIYPEYLSYSDTKAVYGTIEGRENPIKSFELLQMFKQVIIEETQKGIEPHRGEFHQWSSDYLRENKKHLSPWQGSKLFICLAMGCTSKFMFTGKEKELSQWILAQEDMSITIHEMFRKSYQLHNGNIYLALLNIENTLSRYWRVKDRANLSLTRKLAKITNNYQGEGDKFGAWYHFFGLVVYGYASGSQIKAGLVGRIETLGSLIASGFKAEKQENWINAKSGAIGVRLRRELYKFNEWSFEENYIDANKYLNLTEDFRDRIPVESDARFTAKIIPRSNFKAKLLLENKTNFQLSNCLLEVIPFINGRFNSRYIEKFENIDIAKGLNTFMIRNTSKVRLFMSGCQKGL